jgi:uncharacterized protein DUF3551
MRLMLIVVTVAMAMLLDLRVSQATQMPWCAGTSKGDFFSYNCSLPTYEMCVQEVIAGNRGFCSPNPYYRGSSTLEPLRRVDWRASHSLRRNPGLIFVTTHENRPGDPGELVGECDC